MRKVSTFPHFLFQLSILMVYRGQFTWIVFVFKENGKQDSNYQRICWESNPDWMPIFNIIMREIFLDNKAADNTS